MASPLPNAIRLTVIAAAALALIAGGCASTGGLREELAARAEARGARVVIAEELVGAEALEGEGRSAAAAARLAVIWPLTSALEDDRLVREAVAALPEAVVPADLRAVWALEQARAARAAGKGRRARKLGLQADSAPGITGARAALLLGIAAAEGAPDEARLYLEQAARHRGERAVDRELRSVAKLTLASMAYAADDLKVATDVFQQVSRKSGSWRAARIGLAWCQIRAGRMSHALKILDLLPGGVGAEPERALAAAVAADQLGRGDLARQIAEAGLAAAEGWRAEAVTVAALLEAPLAGGADDPVALTRDRPPVRVLIRELEQTRAAIASAPELAGYEAALRARLEVVAASEARAEQDRAGRYAADLRTLLPQLGDVEAPR